MGLWNWLFGSKSEQCESPPAHKHKCQPLPLVKDQSTYDSRNVLNSDEEWVIPEEWFYDTDGKRVRRKRKKAESCDDDETVEFGANVEDVGSDLVGDIVNVGNNDSVQENEDSPGFVDPDVPTSSIDSISYSPPPPPDYSYSPPPPPDYSYSPPPPPDYSYSPPPPPDYSYSPPPPPDYSYSPPPPSSDSSWSSSGSDFSSSSGGSDW